MDQKKIGIFLKELRKERNLTQEQLAEIFGVTNRSVSRWENGVNLPDFDLVIEIVNYFDISIEEFFDGERRKEMIDKKTEETMLKVSEYENSEKMRFSKRMCRIFIAGIIAFIIFMVIDMNGLASEGVYEDVASFALGFVFGVLILGALMTSRYISKIRETKKKLLRKLTKADVR